MGKLFNMDSPVMVVLGKIADLMILNVITVIACIPIITIGASLTGMHYVLLKMVRGEEGYLFRSFRKSFKENFRQATICWLIVFLFILILIGDIFILNYSSLQFASWLRIALIAVGFMGLMVVIYIFPLLSRFDNNVRGIFKNAFLISIMSLPKTVVMLIIYCSPAILIGISRVGISLSLVPVVFLLGITGPAYLCAILYSGIFKKFEPESTEDDGDNWSVENEENS